MRPSRLQLIYVIDRYPEIEPLAVLRTIEAIAGDTDDGERSAVDGDSLAERRRLGAEPTLPQVVADHGCWLLRRPLLTRDESPAQRQWCIQQGEVVRRNDRAAHALRGAASRDREPSRR